MTNERHEKALEAAEWIKHDGKGMPFKASERVAVRFRDGDEETPGPAGMWNYGDGTSSWKHQGFSSDITHYQLPSKAPNHFTNGE